MAATNPPYIKKPGGMFVPDYWDRGYRAARDNALAAPLRVLFIGDSITNGQPGNQAIGNTQDWLNQSYYGYLRDILATRTPGGLGAEYFGPAESVLRNPFYHDGSGATPNGPLFYADGANAGPNGKTPANYAWTTVQNGWWFLVQSANTGLWTTDTSYMAAFKGPRSDTVRVDALYANHFGNAAPSWKYGPNADGSGATTVSGFAPSSNAVYRTTVFSGAASRPAIYFGSQGHTSDFYLLGCVAYGNTALGGSAVSNGLQIARMGFTGMTAGGFTQLKGLPSDRAKGIVGGWNGTTYDAIGFPTAPDLLVFALAINDCNRSRPDSEGVNADPHTYGMVLRRTIEAGLRAKPTMSTLILLPYYSPIDYADAPAFSFNDSWPDYHNAAQAVAVEYGCGLASVNQRWGASAAARGFVPSNDGHLLAAGGADIAQMLAEVL